MGLRVKILLLLTVFVKDHFRCGSIFKLKFETDHAFTVECWKSTDVLICKIHTNFADIRKANKETHEKFLLERNLHAFNCHCLTVERHRV